MDFLLIIILLHNLRLPDPVTTEILLKDVLLESRIHLIKESPPSLDKAKFPQTNDGNDDRHNHRFSTQLLVRLWYIWWLQSHQFSSADEETWLVLKVWSEKEWGKYKTLWGSCATGYLVRQQLRSVYQIFIDPGTAGSYWVSDSVNWNELCWMYRRKNSSMDKLS